MTHAQYGSPTISAHRLVPSVPYIRHLADFTFPATTDSAESHPHQVILHPSIPGLAYVPDLGLNTIYTLRLDHAEVGFLGQVFIPEDLGIGPRHGVMSRDGEQAPRNNSGAHADGQPDTSLSVSKRPTRSP